MQTKAESKWWTGSNLEEIQAWAGDRYTTVQNQTTLLVFRGGVRLFELEEGHALVKDPQGPEIESWIQWVVRKIDEGHQKVREFYAGAAERRGNQIKEAPDAR